MPILGHPKDSFWSYSGCRNQISRWCYHMIYDVFLPKNIYNLFGQFWWKLDSKISKFYIFYLQPSNLKKSTPKSIHLDMWPDSFILENLRLYKIEFKILDPGLTNTWSVRWPNVRIHVRWFRFTYVTLFHTELTTSKCLCEFYRKGLIKG